MCIVSYIRRSSYLFNFSVYNFCSHFNHIERPGYFGKIWIKELKNKHEIFLTVLENATLNSHKRINVYKESTLFCSEEQEFT